MTDSDPYHELRRVDRDHLLAAAWHAADHDTLPAGSEVGRVVETLTGDKPTRNTTGDALARLADRGFVARVDGVPDDRSRGVRVTDDGYRALQRGATRLDAAATVDA